jgi:serine/threonine protein kinase
VVDPAKRYTFEQIVNHPFMSPKCGIPKELPTICLTHSPKFGVFERYEQEPVKKSAKDASVVSLRSSIDLRIEQDFEGLDLSKHNQLHSDNETKKGPRNIKGLSRSVFSTSSLSKSLQKLSDLSKASIQPPKTLRTTQPPRLSNESRVSIGPHRFLNSSMNGSHISPRN